MRRRLVPFLALVLVLGALVGLRLLVWDKTGEADKNADERDQATAVTVSLAQQLIALCADESSTQARELRAAGVCASAQKAKDDADDGKVPDPILIPGPTGATGPVGPRGVRGVAGTDGTDGAEGKRGPRGFTGLDGTDGAAGQNGAQGGTGPAGPAGPQGPSGSNGSNGQDGATGPVGPPGTALPGSYQCPDGQVLTGFTVAADGSVSLNCQAQILP